MDLERAWLLDEDGPAGSTDPRGGDTSSGRLRMTFGARSDQGGRRRNEDSCAIAETISCVSDGIGGADYGDVMSKLVVATMCEEWDGLAGSDVGAEERMRLALERTDEFLSRVASRLGGGPGATVVAVAQVDDALIFGSVGDSRAFLLDSRGLVPVFPDSGRESDQGNALSSALGYGMLQRDRDVASVTSLKEEEGARVLLCTDGVWASLSDDEMEEALRSGAHPWVSARSLVEKSVKAGGARGDNATALVGMVGRESSSFEKTPTCSSTEHEEGTLS